MPKLSHQFSIRTPSAVRLAQIEFQNRRQNDPQIEAINVSIGNVSIPMHPAMTMKLAELATPGHKFADGIVRYTETVGTSDANATVMHILSASGIDTAGLQSLITSGGSQAMELAIIGTGGPILLLDAAYPNYLQFANRLNIPTVSLTRHLASDGSFTLPSVEELESIIKDQKPTTLILIPYDNPTGQYYRQSQINEIARLCVKHDLWIISDEAYRELFYTGGDASSIWKTSEVEVPGITGRRISIESTSKVWNACGLRIGALVTDNPDFLRQAVAENTANLAPSTIGQEIFSSLLSVPIGELKQWFASQRSYYSSLMNSLALEFKTQLPDLIVSQPNSAIYSVIDLKNLVTPDFDVSKFVLWCAKSGEVSINGKRLTLLSTSMPGFYSNTAPDFINPGRTQIRISYVETLDQLMIVPTLLKELLHHYLLTLNK